MEVDDAPDTAGADVDADPGRFPVGIALTAGTELGEEALGSATNAEAEALGTLGGCPEMEAGTLGAFVATVESTGIEVVATDAEGGGGIETPPLAPGIALAPAPALVAPGGAAPCPAPPETPANTCRATDAISGCANKLKAAKTARAVAGFA